MGKKKAGTPTSGATRSGSSTGAKAAEEDDDAVLDAALEAAGAVRGKAAELNILGDECAARGDWGRAVVQYSQAIEVDPNNGLHYCKRAAAHLGAGRVADAVSDARTGATLGGTSAAESAICFGQLGFALCKDGKLQAALEAFDKGSKLDSDSAACRQGRDEAAVLLEQHSGGKLPPQVQPHDVEAQELRTLPAPEEVLGKGFEVVHLLVGSFDKPLRFLLATTLLDEAVITANTCAMLGMAIKRTVDLQDVRFEGGHAIGTFHGCSVGGFFQADMAHKALGTMIHGMLGLPFMARYDFLLDRVRAEQHFKEAGAAALLGAETGNARMGTIHLPGVSLPGSLLGIPTQVRAPKVKKTAVGVLGIVDTGSMFTIMSWAAAKALGIASGPDDPSLRDATKVAGVTKDGVAEMPLVNVKVCFCSTSEGVGCRMGGLTMDEFEAAGKGRGWSLDLKAASLRPCAEFGRVNAAIGDAFQFSLLSDSAVGDFTGAAILIGQDVLAQAPRLTFSMKDRQLWLDPPGRVIDAVPM